MENLGKLKIRHVGEFEIHTFAELESMVNDKDSVIRLKFRGQDED